MTLKEVIQSKCINELGVTIPVALINHICNYVDLSKQYTITPVSNKTFMENNVYNGYSRDEYDEVDIITRYRVTKIAGDVKTGYRRNTKIIYKSKVRSDICVVCMQQFKQGRYENYIREFSYNLYIYIRKED